MSNRPSSYFGFGVVLDEGTELPGGCNQEGSPACLAWMGMTEGDVIAVEAAGYCDEPYYLVVIADSLSKSDDWQPARVPDAVVPAVRAEWRATIEAFLDKWNLRASVREKFKEPGFVHAPYYG